jgi:hypothetical protein
MSSSIQNAPRVAAVGDVAGVATRLSPAARRAAMIVAAAFRETFYGTTVPGAAGRTLKNLDFHTLQRVYVEAAHQVSDGRGAVIVANRMQLRRLASELARREFDDDRQVPSGTVGAMVSHWQAVFRNGDGCIESQPVRVGRTRYIVRFYMTHEDTGQYRFWVSIFTTSGKPVVQTSEKSDPEVHLLTALDVSLARQVIENERALLRVQQYLAQHPAKSVVGFIVLAAAITLLSSEKARAAAVESVTDVVEWVGELVMRKPAVINPNPTPIPIDVPAPTKELVPTAPVNSTGAAPMLPESIFAERTLPSIGSTDALKRLFASPVGTISTDLPKIHDGNLRAAIYEVVMRGTPDANRIRLQESAFHPYAGNIVARTMQRTGNSVRVVFSMHPMAAASGLYRPSTFKWSFLRVLPDGRLDRHAVGFGQQVDQVFDIFEAYVVLAVAETDPFVPPGRSCGTSQYFESGMAILPQLATTTSAVSRENVLEYIADEYNFQPFVQYGQEKGDSDHRVVFAIWPGHLDLRNRELFIDFGDGQTADTGFIRSHPDAGSMSLYEDYWLIEHEYGTSGQRKIVVKVLDNTTKTGHPNHPVVREFPGAVNVY